MDGRTESAEADSAKNSSYQIAQHDHPFVRMIEFDNRVVQQVKAAKDPYDPLPYLVLESIDKDDEPADYANDRTYDSEDKHGLR